MSLTGENKAIKFPKTHYVGMIGRKEDVLPLGFMTPDGTDKAAEKRKATVDGWVDDNVRYRQRGEDKVIAAKRTLENTPLIGFRLTRQIKRDSGWGSGNVKWRIEDPRGFELEITSPNMARVIDSCVIDNGEILEECVWARLGAENILVPVSSDLYQAAQRNEERMGTKVKPSEVERGDFVVLHNGNEGVYLGKFESFERDYNRNKHYMFEYQWKNKPVHAMIMESKDHEGKPFKHLTTFATFKPSYVTKREGGPLTPEEAEALAWSAEKEHNYYRSTRLYLVKTPIEYKETPTTLDEAIKDEYGRKGKLVAKRGEEMLLISFSKYQYDDWLKSKTAPPPNQPQHYAYGRDDRWTCDITKVTRDSDGHYILHYDDHRSYHYQRPRMKFDELATLPLVIVSATVATNDGKKRILN